jgi:SAM-dependent methyltransferase
MLYFLRLVTVDQQRFNRLVVEIANTHGARNDDLDVRVCALVDRLDALTAELTALRDAMAAQSAQRRAPLAGSEGALTDAVAQLRGSEADRTTRQAQYLPLFAGRGDVLDVGCGRGEFLALLRDAGVAARGVDSDPAMQRHCTEKGLDVVCNDALDHLESLPDQSLGGIFCAQMIEHLGTHDLLRFIDLARRRLRPGGILLAETLNPESLLVLYRWLWVDLTHQRLVHPESLRALLAASGFHDVTIRYVPPPHGALHIPALDVPAVPAEQMAGFNAATRYLNELLYASFDYAAIGTR